MRRGAGDRFNRMIPGEARRREIHPMCRALHADAAAPGIQRITIQPFQHKLRADIVAGDDHVHESIAQRNDAAWRHVLIGAAIHPFLQARFNGAWLI